MPLFRNTPSLTPATIGLSAIIFGLGGFLAWAALAPITGGAVAPGQIAPEGSVRSIQSQTSGLVSEVFVREGEVVQSGQPLVAVDVTENASELSAVQARIASRRILINRILLEIEERGDPGFCEEFSDGSATLEIREFCANQQRILDLNLASAAREEELLQSQIARLEADRGAHGRQLAFQAEKRALLAEELAAVEQLYEKGLTTRPRVSALRREIAALDQGSAGLEAEQEIAGHAIAEKRSEIDAVKSRRVRENTARLAALENELFELTLSRDLLEEALDRATIRAPVDGRILNLPADIQGQVVASGEQVLNLVPARERLVVEAQLRPNDVDRVMEGQRARVLFPAFSSYRLPRITGRVAYVSAATVSDAAGAPDFYRVRLELDEDATEAVARATGGRGAILPGMAAEVIIETERRTFLAYVTEPLRRSVMFAFREG